MSKHTIGPWLRDASSGIRCDVRSASGRKIALCWGLSTSRAARNNRPEYLAECDANALLIAAAPELVSLLDDFVNGRGGPLLKEHARALLARINA